MADTLPFRDTEYEQTPQEGRRLHKRQHPEWIEHRLRWQWLLDSYEGGEVYRQAFYGIDSRGFPIRNLVRHKREYPDPREGTETGTAYPAGRADGAANVLARPGSGSPFGIDPSTFATDDDYELRRARTPIPTFVHEACDTHLGKIFAKEIERKVADVHEAPALERAIAAEDQLPPDLVSLWEFWEDVDGHGSSIDHFMESTVAPLLLVLGQLDLMFLHPPAPADAEIKTWADQKTFDLTRCVIKIILPENLPWWRLDAHGRQYAEAMVREYPWIAEGDYRPSYRLWTKNDSVFIHNDGAQDPPVPHPFGRVPIIRIFDRRKPRKTHVGQSRYEATADRMREYYNRSSELILSDTQQAHPLLQGPEDYVQADGTIPVGPSWLLPMKKNSANGSASYQGFNVIEFPKEGAASIRLNLADIRNDVDRDNKLTKPAGSEGTSGSTVGQSGVSKRLDATDGNKWLASIAKVLQRCERHIAEYALIVLNDQPEVEDLLDQIKILYPTTFDLFSVDELLLSLQGFQGVLEAAGQVPETEILWLTEIVRAALPGRDDDEYRGAALEIRDRVEALAARRGESEEAGHALMLQGATVMEGTESAADSQDEADEGDDSGGGGPEASNTNAIVGPSAAALA